jgi:hypothetical protein
MQDRRTKEMRADERLIVSQVMMEIDGSAGVRPSAVTTFL